MSSVRYLALATAALSLSSCSLFNKGGNENYDTVDGGDQYDTSNPYGVPGDASAESVPYQPVNPPADHNPTYGQAAYEDHSAAPAPSHSEPSHSHTPSHSSAGTSHTVVRGDTLGGIARRYGVSTSAIKQANGMTSDTVVLGKTLSIPGSSGPVRSAATAPAAAGRKTHVVVRGDSLSKIAAKYGTTASAIKQANGMKSDTVVLGSKLRIP
ncbi:LysM peptidoglycan-binding domain-containing protein [Luteolibacter flavescens]|uniref:LysM peptidoglycan-binding domain-containing protein n=1 Tax=Luteolibacter flavescens TaxID=1859460 RepID=A0ABT3FMF0_9BACT|nr:LysM peptidoglycan-binding domain-containing protein [Luteolibacter flavescens]MCW1884436.1 LysM peptidoglycan-binding domain-containing protein [Luteolibacter flavescens]